MIKEQYLIVKNLPDGALIHRQVLQNPYTSNSQHKPEDSTNQDDEIASKSPVVINSSKVQAVGPIDIKIKYFNDTLKKMFRLESSCDIDLHQDKRFEVSSDCPSDQQQTNQKTFKQQSQDNSMNENYPDKSCEQNLKPAVELIESKQENLMTLDNIYLQRLSYKIIDSKIHQLDERVQQPKSMKDEIKHLNKLNGQVYRVLIKEEGSDDFVNLSNPQKSLTFADRVQNFNKRSNQESFEWINKVMESKSNNSSKVEQKQQSLKDQDLLIQIINQEVLFDGEVSTITYFRDITYSLHYEQNIIEKRQDQIITAEAQNDLLNQFKIFRTKFKNNDKLTIVSQEQLLMQYKTIRNQIKQVRKKSKIMTFALYNLVDMHAIRRGLFNKRMCQFNLKSCVNHLKNLMYQQDWNPNLRLEFLENLTESIEVIGDSQRIQQIAINVFQSVIHFRKTHIEVQVEFNRSPGCLEFIFKDPVTLLSDKDVYNLNIFFKVEKSFNQLNHLQNYQSFERYFESINFIGIGVYLAKQILQEFDGKISIESSCRHGTSIAFSLIVELLSLPPAEKLNINDQFDSEHNQIHDSANVTQSEHNNNAEKNDVLFLRTNIWGPEICSGLSNYASSKNPSLRAPKNDVENILNIEDKNLSDDY